MKLITALLVSIVVVSAAFATEQPTAEQQAAQQATCEKLKTENASPQILAGQGCCSHHSGECGCQNGKTVCCDGTLSPSCTCNHEDPPVIIN